MISLRQLMAQACPDALSPQTLPQREVRGVECDSRKIEKDFVFVAIRGTKKDGSEYIREAISRGAMAVVLDQPQIVADTVPLIVVGQARLAAAQIASCFYGKPSEQMQMIGITGTNGKTTSSYLLEHLLSKENKKVGVLGTVSNRFNGIEEMALETTPGPFRLHAILAQMRKASCDTVVMEVSSHALDQDRVSGIAFRSALFTNLTQDHLDYHKNLEDYFECKARLFLGLSADHTAVLNQDDARVRGLAGRLRSKIMTYGISEKSDLMAELLTVESKGTVISISFRNKKSKIRLPLVGTHNVYNALGALGVMASLGFNVQESAESLQDFKGAPGRLESVEGGQDFSILIDFAHTPDGLMNVLSSLLPYKKKKLFLVFGCGGDRDKTKRPQMAAIASRFADFIYVTSDNPRSEDPKDIAKNIVSGFPEGFKNYAVVLDRKKAIRQALMAARREDIVLLAGKGHEKTQVIGTQAHPFSERDEVEKVLSGR